MGGAVNPQFSWLGWFGGFLLSLFVGVIGNLFAGLFAMGAGYRAAGLLLGLIPGTALILLALAFRARWQGFAIGLLTGACMIAIVGGLCGWAMVGERIAG